MAEATLTEVYQSFCDEEILLQASIQGLEASPALDSLDTLSAAKTRLALVQDAMPALCVASEREQAAARQLALLALHGPRWESAAAAKVTVLASVATLLGQLKTAVDQYSTAHGQQMACLFALPGYAPTYRATYGPMPARLTQILEIIVKGDGAWMANLLAFDDIGRASTLPSEL